MTSTGEITSVRPVLDDVAVIEAQTKRGKVLDQLKAVEAELAAVLADKGESVTEAAEAVLKGRTVAAVAKAHREQATEALVAKREILTRAAELANRDLAEAQRAASRAVCEAIEPKAAQVRGAVRNAVLNLKDALAEQYTFIREVRALGVGRADLPETFHLRPVEQQLAAVLDRQASLSKTFWTTY